MRSGPLVLTMLALLAAGCGDDAGTPTSPEAGVATIWFKVDTTCPSGVVTYFFLDGRYVGQSVAGGDGVVVHTDTGVHAYSASDSRGAVWRAQEFTLEREFRVVNVSCE